MNEATLPPSPNWYLNTILSCANDGTVVWGARNVLVISKCDSDKSIRKYSVIRSAHKEKVTSVSLAQTSNDNKRLLASTGDDAIKIWNTNTLSLIHSHIPDYSKHAITTEWCPHETHALYALTSDGTLIMWNLRFNTISTFTLGKLSATCMSCCPHQKNLLAVGTKNGLVYVVNYGSKGSVLYKLRGHDTEIVSLSWCPSDMNVIAKNEQRDLLLASGGRDRNIFIWRAGSDGRYESQIALATTPFGLSQHRSKLNPSTGDWITVNWVEPNLLLSSSTWGELMSFDLSRQMKGKPFSKLVHSEHLRGLFCIAKVPKDSGNEGEPENRLTVWTVAQDRQIIGCKISDTNVEIAHSIPTQGGYVYCIAACPFDTSRLAFGVGDAMLRIWNLSEPHTTSFNVTTLWQKIKGKIRAVSWHPEKESLLAYATDEGRVGVFDVNSSKPPLLYRQYHRNKVYALGWGPCPSFKKPVLYSCAEGQMVYYDPDQVNKEAITVIKKDCSEFAWKPDFSYLAVGHEDGSIQFLDRNLVSRAATKPCGKKAVHCIAWHPESTVADLDFSPLRNCIAVAYNSPVITIFDLSKFVETVEKDSESADAVTNSYNVHEVVATLNGHVEKVVSLAWSPHLTGQLVSGSYDNTAQVWDVEAQELLATYTGHTAPVLCVSWSPLHPDFLITGSADFTLRVWNVKELTPILPTETAKNTKKSKKKADNQSSKSEASGNQSVKDTLTARLADLSMEQKTKKKKKIERLQYFPKTAKILNDNDTMLKSLVAITNSVNRDAEGTSLPLFAEHETFLSYLKDENKTHTAEKRHTVAAEMSVWCDNLKEELERATKENRLTDFLVSLAPSLSTKIWKETCEAYAHQLAAESNPQKAVTFLLSIHKTYEAIDVLENADLYQEAYAIARCRLDANDPVINSILEKWAEYYVSLGRFEHAAYIYGRLKNFEKAIKYLSRRTSAKTLGIVADIAVSCKESDKALSLADQSINAALLHSEYDVARDVIAKFPQLKYKEVHLECLKELREIVKKRIDRGTIEGWIKGTTDYRLLDSLRNRLGTPEYYLDLSRKSYTDSEDNEEMLWVEVSREIAMAITCEEREKRLKHIAGALGLVSQYEIHHYNDFENRDSPLLGLIMHLDSASAAQSIYNRSEFPVSASLRAYLCYALLSWMVTVITKTVGEREEHIATVVNTMTELNIIDDLMSQPAVRHWRIQSAIPQLQTKLSTALGQTEDNEEERTSLKEKLNRLKQERKQFIDEYVSMPSPAMAYFNMFQLKAIPKAETVCERIAELWKDLACDTI